MLQAISPSQASAPISPPDDVSTAPVHATNASARLSRPAHQGHGGRATTPPHNGTAQYRPRTPSPGRPFPPSGTPRHNATGSFPIGHKSRSYSSGRHSHMNQGHKSPSQPHTQPNPAVRYRNSSPYQTDQGRNSALNRPHYANQGQRPAFHRSPSQPRANYGSSYRPRSQSPGLNNSQHRSKSVDRHQPRFARGQSPRDLGAIMADIPGIGLAQS